MKKPFLEAGQIVSTHGVRGDVKVMPWADDPEFRVTFDREILARTDRLSLREEPDGVPLTEEGTVLAEVKVSGGIPLWLTHFLTERRIFKTSFSKYGTAYRLLSTPAAAKKGEIVYVDFSRAV